MIKAICVLHNFIRLHDGVFTLPSEIFNNDDEDGNLFEDEFQQNNQQLNRTRPTNTALSYETDYVHILYNPMQHFIGKINISLIQDKLYV